MQRRKVDLPGSSKDHGRSGSNSSSQFSRKPRRNRGMTVGKFVMIVLVAACLLAGAAMFFFPTQVQEVETETAKKTKDFVNNAFEMEQEMEKQFGNLLLHRNQPIAIQPPLQADDTNKQRTNEEATAEMEKQPSSWVDGEKKLKEKLKVLYERQKNGQDLGVPVLTRYLGEDIPAWPGEGVDEKEWKKQVDAKYREMAKEESKWRQDIMKKMDERNKQKATLR